MAQSLNTKVELAAKGIAYLGFAKYGKLLMGDYAFEFYNDNNVEDNIVVPYDKIKYVEGTVFNGKVGRRFTIVLLNNSRLGFGSKESGKALKILRNHLGNEKVVKAPSVWKTLKTSFNRLFHRKNK